MKNLSITCMALVPLVFFGQTAKAAPVSLALTLTTDSGVTLFTSTVGGSVSAIVSFDVTGSVDVTLDDAIDDPLGTNDTTSISFDDAEIDFSDETLVFDLGILGSVDGEFIGLGINLLTSNGSIPLTTTLAADPFAYTFDPGGGSPTEFAVDEGLFVTSGSFGTVFVSNTLDFSNAPLGGTVDPVGQIGLVTQDLTLTGNTLVVDVLMSAPLTFSDSIVTEGQTIDLEFSAILIATGSYTTIVPEPSTVVLLGLAAAGLIPLWRRLRRSS